MSNANKALLIVLCIWSIIVGLFALSDYLARKKQEKIEEQRKPQCFLHTVDVVRLRFYHNGIFHIFAIKDSVIFQHLKAFPDSFAVEYYDLYTQYKVKCPKVQSIVKHLLPGIIKDRELTRYIDRVFNDLDMWD